jgi:hypothetical protein
LGADDALAAKRLGSKPCVAFVGEPWDVPGSEHSRLRSLLLDGNQLGRLPEDAFRGLALLEHLDLSDQRAGDDGGGGGGGFGGGGGVGGGVGGVGGGDSGGCPGGLVWGGAAVVEGAAVVRLDLTGTQEKSHRLLLGKEDSLADYIRSNERAFDARGL